ncbi:MAG: type II toxin-antitoxin system RelE/ParE family toxin [Candidatus Thermoplasmatota archaeon]
MEVVIHPRVQNDREIKTPSILKNKKFSADSDEKERLVEHLKKLADDPYTSRNGADIKKLKGKKHDMYRLRIGEHRFKYFVEEGKVWVDEAFRRVRGYR